MGIGFSLTGIKDMTEEEAIEAVAACQRQVCLKGE